MRGRLLIVDDNVELGENLAELLVSEGFLVEVVADAEAALDRLVEGEYCGVLSDLRLPGLSGVQLVEELRRRGVGVPVVIMTAYADPAIVAAAERAGALDVLAKPLDFSRLIDRVQCLAGDHAPVLVVEDDLDLAENVREALLAAGIDSVIVGHCAEAALALRVLPSVAIVDLRLPDLDGIEVARRLLARRPSLQIIFVSGYSERVPSDWTRALGRVEREPRVLPKPFDVRELIACVCQVTAA